MLLVVAEDGVIGVGKLRFAALLHEPNGFADQVHVIAEVADLVVRNVLHLFVESSFVADVIDHGAQGKHGVGREILVANVLRDVFVSVADRSVWADVFSKSVGGLLGNGDEILRVFVCNGVIESIGGGHSSDQNEHDQAHAFLSVVRSVEKADAGAGEDEEAADIKRRRLGAFGSLVQFGIFNQCFGKQQQEGGAPEADHGRKQERLADVGSLAPVHAAGAGFG